MENTYLAIGKDCALVSIENIPNDWLECCLKDIFLCRKAGKDVVEFVAGLDLSGSGSLDDRDGLVGGTCANDWQGSVFLFSFVQWTNTNHYLNRSRCPWRDRLFGCPSRRRRAATG